MDLDFASIRTCSPGDRRPELPDVEFNVPKISRVPIASLERWIRDHRESARGCRAYARQWKDDESISDGQWLANLYDLARSLHLIEMFGNEIDRRRRTAAARQRQPQ